MVLAKLNYCRTSKFFCEMKNTILKQINALGARLGYPFVIYADGTYSKENVLEAKDVPVMAVVKKKMPAKSLNMDFLQGVYADDKNVLRYLSEVGENIGFPYYVYMDGTCGTTPVAAASKYPSYMMVQGKFDSFVLVSGQKVQEKPFREVVPKSKECIFQKSVPTDRDLAKLAEVRAKMQTEGYLGVTDTRVLVKFGTDDEVSNYIENNFLYSSLLAEYCSDEVVLRYAQKKQITVTNLLKMLEKGRLKLIEKIQDVCSFNAPNSIGKRFPNIETLIKHGCQYLLKTQIQKYGSWFEPQEVLLINTGDTEMIRYYLDYHNFAEHTAAQRALIGLKQPDLVKLYQQKYGFDKECYQMAVDNGLLSA